MAEIILTAWFVCGLLALFLIVWDISRTQDITIENVTLLAIFSLVLGPFALLYELAYQAWDYITAPIRADAINRVLNKVVLKQRKTGDHNDRA